MRARYASIRAVFGAAGLCATALLWLTGCSWMPWVHHNAAGGCSEAPFAGNSDNRPLLTIPPGLNAPDTRNAIKVPTLSEPEHVRSKNEPCLADPPSYAAGASPQTPRS